MPNRPPVEEAEEEEEEINVVDLSDQEDADLSDQSAPSCSRSSSVRSANGKPDSSFIAQQPLDLSRKSKKALAVENSRPSVIKCQESFELPDVDEHFRKSLSFTPNHLNAEAKVDDHFARALGEVWWALKEKMQTDGGSDEGRMSCTTESPSPQSSGKSTTNVLCHMQVPFG